MSTHQSGVSVVPVMSSRLGVTRYDFHARTAATGVTGLSTRSRSCSSFAVLSTSRIVREKPRSEQHRCRAGPRETCTHANRRTNNDRHGSITRFYHGRSFRRFNGQTSTANREHLPQARGMKGARPTCHVFTSRKHEGSMVFATRCTLSSLFFLPLLFWTFTNPVALSGHTGWRILQETAEAQQVSRATVLVSRARPCSLVRRIRRSVSSCGVSTSSITTLDFRRNGVSCGGI